MKYQIASSSTEEGEVHENTFPYAKSQLKYLYYPKSSLFIGPNTLPTIANYTSQTVCQKLKKEIKADYSHVSFGLLDSSKLFFENRFRRVGSLGSAERVVSLGRADPARGKGSGDYGSFAQQQLFSKEVPTHARVFIVEDRMLDALERSNAYVFLRASENREAKTRRYVLEDVFYSECGFYEYLEMCGRLIKGQEEVRRYEAKLNNWMGTGVDTIVSSGANTRVSTGLDALVTLYSSTTFMDEEGEHRLYSIPESGRDRIAVVNKDGVKLQPVQGQPNGSMGRLVTLDVEEGDYVINNWTVYKMGVEGDKVEFVGIKYDDLLDV